MEHENSEDHAEYAAMQSGGAVLTAASPRPRFSFHVPRVVDHFALAFVLYFLV